MLIPFYDFQGGIFSCIPGFRLPLFSQAGWGTTWQEHLLAGTSPGMQKFRIPPLWL